MNVVLTQPVEIALRTLGANDRRKVMDWFDHLKNWESDSFVREHSHKLESHGDVYVLRTTSEFRIFFALQQNQITVLDIATRDTILTSGSISGTAR